MPLLLTIALKHLLARKRQSIVSLLGIILGVAFFLAISSLMRGSENDFIRRLVDNSPHITISDEFRDASIQPVQILYPEGAVEVRSAQPMPETRGIRGYEQALKVLRSIPGAKASPLMAGQALVSFAGRDVAITLNGAIPEEITTVSTLENYMLKGTLSALVSNPDGIIIGQELAKRLSLTMGDNVTVAAPTGQVRTFKVAGIFRTGRSSYDQSQTFTDLKRVQALLNRSNRINTIIVKLPNPYQARDIASSIERQTGYKSVSWQEASEDILSTLVIRNIIMYTVVSAVLIVAAFGIYNVISTIVMEKHRDIAILKSIGFQGKDIQAIFLIQGVILGFIGSITGLPLGSGMMLALMQVRLKPPGGSEMVNMPLDWSWPQFAVAGAFAMIAAIFAAWLPARKGAKVQPVEILRGGM